MKDLLTMKQHQPCACFQTRAPSCAVLRLAVISTVSPTDTVPEVWRVTRLTPKNVECFQDLMPETQEHAIVMHSAKAKPTFRWTCNSHILHIQQPTCSFCPAEVGTASEAVQCFQRLLAHSSGLLIHRGELQKNEELKFPSTALLRVDCLT